MHHLRLQLHYRQRHRPFLHHPLPSPLLPSSTPLLPNPTLPTSSSSSAGPSYKTNESSHTNICTSQNAADRRFDLPRDNGGAVVCPKPQRIRVLQLHLYQAKVSDSKAGAVCLDVIVNKEDLEIEQGQSIASSPPFFCGSPPSRATNPLVQDARFNDERLAQALSTLQIPCASSSLAIKAGCIRMKFGLKPAAVRVEGFDCLSRDSQNSGVPAMA
ncbi:ribulose bisphosphate carboxylase small chain [Hibiscus syriacus]|uniref:Ribulose bisphosphate carboxylase small chain n=1 Tax=Hibiscus syriacus TaxID=106335 RepID=A0A6A3CAE2_HIBSY|nr:ribulose bisphosphate carboxylase small chain [Hibiscus syriacus]